MHNFIGHKIEFSLNSLHVEKYRTQKVIVAWENSKSSLYLNYISFGPTQACHSILNKADAFSNTN